MEHQFKGMPPSPGLQNAWRQANESQQNGIVRSSDLTRKQREILVRSGRLRQVMRGWYQLCADGSLAETSPDMAAFLPLYLEERLGTQWCLSAATSLAVRFQPEKLPAHVVVQAPYGSTTVHTFGDGTRLTVYREENHLPPRLEMIRGLRAMGPETILARLTASQWEENKTLVGRLLEGLENVEAIVWQCLGEGRHQALYRLLEGLQALGKAKEAQLVAHGLQASGLAVPNEHKTTTSETPGTAGPLQDDQEAETDSIPSFLEGKEQVGEPTEPSLSETWEFWSQQIAPGRFRPNNLPGNFLHRLASIENILPEDARHHLGLAGFALPQAATEAIFMEAERAAETAGWPLLEEIQKRLRESETPPLPGEVDPASLVALQGYAEALKLVKRSIVRMLEGRSLETILRQDMRGWRLALMNPSAEAGLIPQQQILRYRDREQRGKMDTWTRLVAGEKDAGRRGILAFLALSQLAPWDTGNKRMALLVLNALNTAAGLPWMVMRRTDEFQQAWDEALRPSSCATLLNIMAESTIV